MTAISAFTGIVSQNSNTLPNTAWATWTGSGNVPFSTYSTDYNQNCLALIALDATRFMMIYGETFANTFVVIGTYGTPGSTPTFGTPVLLDPSLPDVGDVYFGGVKLSANKVYVGYTSLFENTKYGVVFNISGTVPTAATKTSFGTDKAFLYPPNAIAFLTPTKVIECYYDISALVNYFVASIDGSDNITAGASNTVSSPLTASVGSFAVVCPSSSTIISLVVDDNLLFHALLFTVSGTTITGPVSNISLNVSEESNNGASLSIINSTQVIAAINTKNSVSNDTNIYAYILTNTAGTLSAGAELLVDNMVGSTGADNLLYNLQAVGNAENQALLFGLKTNTNQTISNDFVYVLTPNGTSLTKANLIPINPNSANLDAPFLWNACVLDPNTVIAPCSTYVGNAGDWGVTVLNRINDDPGLIFWLEADSGVTANAAGGLVNFSVAAGGEVVHAGNDYTMFFIEGAKFLVVNTAEVLYVDHSTWNGTVTRIFTQDPISNSNPDSPVQFYLIDQIVDKSSNAYVFDQSVSNQKPFVGRINGFPTLCIPGGDGFEPNLARQNIPFPTTDRATLFVVAKTADDASLYYMTGNGNLQISPVLAADSRHFGLFPGTSDITVGSFTVNSDLKLIDLERIPKSSIASVNGVTNATSTSDILAIESIGFNTGLNYFIGSTSQGSMIGNIVAAELWWGILTPAELSARRSYYITKYNL